MIAVIADDLTGAAELAGIGLDYQLKTEFNTIVDSNSRADLLIIATDTRSLSATEAKQTMFELTKQLMALKPRIIFKKIDSVLRGHILDEVNSQMLASGLKRALIVPGNPHHNKVVNNGSYYYNREPIHLSDYSIDPAFPITSSDIKKMLRAKGSLPILKTHEQIPNTGIIVGEAINETDLANWIEIADEHTLIAGASGLFNSLLRHLVPVKPVTDKINTARITPRLFVFGSTFYQGKYPLNDDLIHNTPVAYIPKGIIVEDSPPAYLYAYYANHIMLKLAQYGSAIIAIDHNTIRGLKIAPRQLSFKISAIVKCVSKQAALQEILIEGGATAWAILAALNISKLYPLQQFGPGVMRMGVTGNNQLCVTLKPGSYEWPAPVWETN
ncbi:four-carbon acid sugar kinase family protein [Mucilaginibacter sp. SP1R1]|uniref:four-carbon acid sugar kinase family protein n=1 Tax=Mucilaginibacter sp. SP1R1 TaxID=2723091 RepID=UPI0016112031|nr:four-carbon acid sugar kinase family protein [Mucilaginibacter sp. SP1R1]MBB6148625.1 uncharacterized protein YgbK (DUF1537 family) [Mucilaginibacter sp. SP1R1]